MLHNMDSVNNQCPCGSGKPFRFCCEPAIEGHKPAKTAEALMRSRYSAFSLGAIDYLIQTTAPEKRFPDDAELLQEQCKATIWTGLDILGATRGSAQDQTGTVEFEAHFESGEQHGTLREHSNFRRDNDRWYYVDGDVEVITH